MADAKFCLAVTMESSTQGIFHFNACKKLVRHEQVLRDDRVKIPSTMVALWRSFFTLCLLSSLCWISNGDLFTTEHQNVQILSTNKDIEAMKQDTALWMLLIDQSPTSHAQLDQIYTALAQMVNGIFKLGLIDIETDHGRELAKEYRVRSTPAVVVVGDDKTKALSKTTSGWDLQKLTDELLSGLGKTIQARSTKLHGDFASSKAKAKPAKILDLTAANFAELVYDNPSVVLVAFAAPWCGHCQRLRPEWEEAAAKLSGSGAELGWVDATVETSLAAQYNVRGYPTIKVFPGGRKTSADAFDYPGERTAAGIVAAALDQVDRTGVPPPIPQLTSASVLEESCAGANRLCVLAALPHILDSGAAGRRKYLDLLATVAKTFRKASGAFAFLWFEGTSQPELEQGLELTFGFPAVVALSYDRQAYAVLHGSFAEKSMTTFLHSITTGRQATIPLKEIPTVVTTEEWDGEDGQPVEEELSLEEIMGWADEEDATGGEL